MGAQQNADFRPMIVGCIKSADYKTLSSIPAQDTTNLFQTEMKASHAKILFIGTIQNETPIIQTEVGRFTNYLISCARVI
jgi:hypothetical protein